MIIVKGKHAVLEALKGTNFVQEVIVLTQARSKEINHVVTVAKQKQVQVSYCDKKVAQKRYQVDGHQQVLARLSHIQTVDLSSIQPETHPVIVVLDHLEDPYNVGAIMRTAEGLGVSAIVMPKNRQAPIDGGMIKASSGACYYLDIVQVANVGQALISCEQKGYWIYGADSNNGQPLNDFQPTFPMVLVVGNEHKGLSARIVGMLHQPIYIPMQGHIDSLNVSVATGIILNHCMNLLK